MLRGSGLNGLVSLNKKNKIGNKNLLRPLLNQKKEDLDIFQKMFLIFTLKIQLIKMINI